MTIAPNLGVSHVDTAPAPQDGVAVLLDRITVLEARLRKSNAHGARQLKRAEMWSDRWSKDFARKRLTLLCGRCGCTVVGHGARGVGS